MAASDYALTWGFYRWPQGREIDLAPDREASSASVRLTLRQVSRSHQGNWIIGGFAMTVVEGQLRLDDQVLPVIGLVELIK